MDLNKAQRMARSLSIKGSEGCARDAQRKIGEVDQMDQDEPAATQEIADSRAHYRLANSEKLEEAREALAIRVKAGGS